MGGRLKSHFANARGFSLLMVLLVAVLVSGSMVLLLGKGSSLFKQQAHQVVFQVENISDIFVKTLKNDQAWLNTVTSNHSASVGGFDCLFDSSQTCAGSVGSFPVYDITNNKLGGGPQSNGYYGFSRSGGPCSTFSPPPGAGDDNCPFGLSVSWTASCPGAGPCKNFNSTIAVTGTWTYNSATPQRTIAFNNQNYNFTVLRGVTGSTPGFNLQVYNVPGNYVFKVPDGINTLIVEAWGAGGSGCGGGGGGGGGGAYTYCTLGVSPGQAFSVVVGAGGPFGACYNNGTCPVQACQSGGTYGGSPLSSGLSP